MGKNCIRLFELKPVCGAIPYLNLVAKGVLILIHGAITFGLMV